MKRLEQARRLRAPVQNWWGSPLCATDDVLPAVLLWIGLFSHSWLSVRLSGSQKNTGNVIAHCADIAVGVKGVSVLNGNMTVNHLSKWRRMLELGLELRR